MLVTQPPVKSLKILHAMLRGTRLLNAWVYLYLLLGLAMGVSGISRSTSAKTDVLDHFSRQKRYGREKLNTIHLRLHLKPRINIPSIPLFYGPDSDTLSRSRYAQNLC